MKNRSESPDGQEALRKKLAGLGEFSIRKTYYPALQERLEELERFKAFIDHSNDAIFLIEVPTARIVDVNDSASRQMGWSHEEFLEASLFDLSDLAHCPDAERLISKPLEEANERTLAVTELHRKDGGRFPAELTLNRMHFGNEAYVLAVARDITERKRAEEALRQSEAFLKNIVENIPAMVFAKDAIDLRYVTFNKAAEELLGYSREEILGKSDHELFPEEQSSFFTEKDREVLARGDLLEIPEETIKTRDGGDRILRVKKIPLFDGEGNAQFMLGIAEDITDRKHLEEQLLQSQKMEAIGQMAGGVAHDFNNILMVIMGYCASLKRDITLTGPQKERVDKISDSAERATQLTGSLLAFSRKQVIHPRLADLNDIVQHLQTFLVRIIGEDIELKFVPVREKLPVKVDGGQIEQVLINLAANARDAMPKGGLLILETGLLVVDSSSDRGSGYIEPGRYALLSVSDTGSGMDEKTRSKIFEPFFTTKEPGKGTGLGMSIVYGIIRQHNGYITVYSESKTGTTFRIYLPLVEQEPEAVRELGTPEPPEGGTETILVAEDDAAVREIVEEILTDFGYRVILAVDGKDAVEKFKANRDSVKLTLMDMVMPKMSGKEAYDAIRKLDADMKILYISGYTMGIIQNHDELDEGTELIMKPVQPHELLRKVRVLLDESCKR